MSIVHVSPSVIRNLNRPIYLFFLRQIRTLDWKDRFKIALVLGPFLIARAFCTWRFACRRRIFFVILRITSARYIIKDDKAEFFVILGYAPNTSNVSIILSGPAESLTILTTIYNIVFALTPFWSSSRMIL
jgi:hypothetical protein